MWIKPKNDKEYKRMIRKSYEFEKDCLIKEYESKGYPKDGLNRYLVNSLIDSYEDQLKIDGLI